MSSLLTPHTAKPRIEYSPDQLPTLTVPDALLLDFGGVIFETSKYADGRDRLAERYQQLLAGIGAEYSVARLRESIDAGITALKSWKNASSRKLTPRELTHREVIVEFMVSDLPVGHRELLATHAHDLVIQQNRLISGHHLRPGMRELIADCQQRGIPLGIVSNAHAGASHRQILEEHGLGEAFAVQIYSDEVGLRKPHPKILTLAAQALGVDIGTCWYVGDTQDRDVVAGRRAGVGAIILTRCHHTDSPPFAVRDRADVILDTPGGIMALLANATDPADNAPAPAPAPTDNGLTLLIDHGGVISTSQDDPEAQREFLTELADLLSPVARDRNPHELAHTVLQDALAGHRQRKQQRGSRGDYTEVTPRQFWATYGGEDQSASVRALLRANAPRLMADWGRAKSRRTIRTGVAELLSWCTDNGHKVVVVTNTVSGASVRTQLERHGIADSITAVVASDEFGLRKPHPSIIQAALVIAGADPKRTFFLGDKPSTDGLGATACDIAHRVLVRGGSTEEADLQAALDDEVATHILDEPGDLLALMHKAATPTTTKPLN